MKFLYKAILVIPMVIIIVVEVILVIFLVSLSYLEGGVVDVGNYIKRRWGQEEF